MMLSKILGAHVESNFRPNRSKSILGVVVWTSPVCLLTVVLEMLP